MATSATGGFLAPSVMDPFDSELEDIFQATIKGVTGLPGNMVRPMWQVEPSNAPPFDTNWVAFGIAEDGNDVFHYENHNGAADGGNGNTSVESDQLLTVLHSFWGPNSGALIKRYRDGLALSQNRDALRAQGIVLVEVQKAFTVPSLLHQKWVQKRDVRVVFRRRTKTTYPILNVTSAQAILDTEVQQVPIIIQSN